MRSLSSRRFPPSPRPRGYAPAKNYLHGFCKTSPQLHDPGYALGGRGGKGGTAGESLVTPKLGKGRVLYDILEYNPLLDSCNMGSEEWAMIAGSIESHYADYDAFVVLHGTDTMGYTSSALAFSLVNLGKTVVVSGSQIPVSVPRNDGVDNLLDALLIAGNYDIPEVTLLFHHKLMRGNRATKVDASNLDAFASPNMPPLGTLGISARIRWDAVLTPPKQAFKIDTRQCENVRIKQWRQIGVPTLSHIHSASTIAELTPASTLSSPQVTVLQLFPGMSPRIVRSNLAPPVQGCVLLTFGAGNAPDTNMEFLGALKDASDRGVVIVNVSQCGRGLVEGHYATGVALMEAGVVPGADMTVECAIVKLGWLLGTGMPPAEVRKTMERSLRGELTETSPEGQYSLTDKSFITTVYRTLCKQSAADGGGGGGGGGLAGVDQKAGVKFVSDALSPTLACSAASMGAVDELAAMIDGGVSANVADYDDRTSSKVPRNASS